jgi:hypothetical protein
VLVLLRSSDRLSLGRSLPTGGVIRGRDAVIEQ